MNIFATSSCPVESAKALDDKRVDVHEAYKECLRAKWKNDARKPTWYRQDCNPNEWSMV